LLTAPTFVVFFDRDDSDAPFAKAQRGLDCFGQSRAIFPSDRDAILNDLHTRAESFSFWIRVVNAHDFVLQPNAQVALLLEEIEKLPRLRFRGDCDPECDEDGCRSVFVIPSGAQWSRGTPRNYRSVSQGDFSTPLEMTEYLLRD
jgi:hypothetical protein